MATYNFERFLPSAIESALAQDYPRDALDIVVIDDGSTDSTPDVVQPYLEHVRYIRKENGGLLTTVNRGLAEARGEFISLLSGDDEFMPHKTRTQVDFLLERPHVGMVYSDLELVGDGGEPLNASLWQTANIKPVRGRAFGPLLTKNVVSGGAMMFRSSLLPHFHPIPASAAWEDWYIALKIASVAEIDFIPASLYLYRYHGSNMNLGAKGDKLAGLLREELRFRRLLLTEIQPGLLTIAELMAAWGALNGTVTKLSGMSGIGIQELIEVSDEQRARSREAAARGGLALSSGEFDAGVFALVNALAEDPWNGEVQAALLAALAPEEDSAPPAPAPLEGARSFTTLAFADELVAAPEMLAAYAASFSGTDDATLVVTGTDEEIGVLGAALDAAGLGGEGGPDMLAVSAVPPAGSLRAVYSQRPQDGALAALPRVDDSRVALLGEMSRAAAAA
jgi:hypothetical protein